MRVVVVRHRADGGDGGRGGFSAAEAAAGTSVG
jgi:hypothetical protein